MPEKLNIDDVAEEKVRRDEDGELLAERRTIPWKGSETDVEVIPVTLGHLNRYEKMEEGDFDELDTQAIFTIVREHYHEPDFSGWTYQEFEDLKGSRLVELMAAFDLDDVAADAGAGNPRQRRQ